MAEFAELENLLSCWFYESWDVEFEDVDSAVRDWITSDTAACPEVVLAQIRSLKNNEGARDELRGGWDDARFDELLGDLSESITRVAA
jgi:hypothetical protein